MGKGDVRKKHRANSMGAQWWRKLSLPRRGKKETLLAPTADGLGDAQCARVAKRQSRLRKAVEAPRASRAKALAVADWDAARGLARVITPRGNALSSMGFFENGTHWLFPEEAAYLVDRAQMDLRVDGVPASLQRAWGLMVEGLNAVTLDEFCAFAHLRRVGYVVRRYGVDEIDEEALNREAEMEAAGQSHGKNGRRKRARANMCSGRDADDDELLDTVGTVDPSCPAVGDSVIPICEPNVGEGHVHPFMLESEKAAVTRGLLARDELKPSFSVWRVGAYRRRNTHRPLFNLLVSRYEDPPPRHAELTSLLSGCSGKTRLRIALIDRGVVVLVDVANNATPLSARYTSRLVSAPEPVSKTIADSSFPSLGVTPSAGVSAPASLAFATSASFQAVADVSVVPGETTEMLKYDAVRQPIRSGTPDHEAVNVVHTEPHNGYRQQSQTSGPYLFPNAGSKRHPASSQREAVVTGAVLGTSTTVSPAQANFPDVQTVEAVRAAIIALRRVAGVSSVSFGAVVQHLTHAQRGEDVRTAVSYSEENVRLALRELARQDDVVLSSGSAPKVYLTIPG